MAYTVPSTRATDDVITAAQWNADIVENIKFLANPPMVRAIHSLGQNILNVTQTVLSFDTEHYDTDNMHSTVTNSSRITVNTAGKYQFGTNVQIQSNSSGFREVFLRKNGSVLIAYNLLAPANGNVTIANLTTTDTFIVGDYVEVVVYQNSGGTLAVDSTVPSGNRYSPLFWATWVSV